MIVLSLCFVVFSRFYQINLVVSAFYAIFATKIIIDDTRFFSKELLLYKRRADAEFRA